MTPARVILLVFLASFLLAACDRGSTQTAPSPATSSPPDPLANLTSILVREKDIFAANGYGLFRANRTERQWRMLKVPLTMPVGGRFVRSPENTQTIIYDGRAVAPQRKNAVAGLYSSRDAGKTWSLCAAGYFADALLLPDQT